MANPKTKTVEFSVESFVFLFNFVREKIEKSNDCIKRYYELIDIIASGHENNAKIYSHETDAFEMAKKNIIDFSPVYEMLLGIYDFSAEHAYFDVKKDLEQKKKLAMIGLAKDIVDNLKLNEVK